MTAPAALARLNTDPACPPVIRADAWFQMKKARGQALDRDRIRRVMHPPLVLAPDWLVATGAPPSERRTMAEHAAAARRNALARIMGALAEGKAG